METLPLPSEEPEDNLTYKAEAQCNKNKMRYYLSENTTQNSSSSLSSFLSLSGLRWDAGKRLVVIRKHCLPKTLEYYVLHSTTLQSPMLLWHDSQSGPVATTLIHTWIRLLLSIAFFHFDPSSHFGIPGPILGESQGAVGDTRSPAPSDYSVKIMIWATIMMMMNDDVDEMDEDN